MKYSAIVVAILLLPFGAFSQGTSCATAIPISLDGVLRTYPAVSTTGANVLCTANGTTPVTWFRFTSNALGACPLLNITASDSFAIEVAFYTSCSSMLTSSSMCFYSGYGIWAPNENFVVTPNTTYYLRVKTSTACNIILAGQHFTPPNDNCLGAVPIDEASIFPDNNSCNNGATGVTASQLCALILENTAWYQFYVATTGYSIITINNIHCDNGAANNNNGFQIGFFTGSCGALEWKNCFNGSGTTVQATTTFLPAGTKVYVAVDGVSGANCSYTINGFNITGLLGGTLKRFSGWKTERANILQWTISHETGGHYEIERSANGVDFHSIGRVNSRRLSNSETESYSMEDIGPPAKSFYRLKQVDQEGKFTLSHIISLNRESIPGFNVSFTNPVGHTLTVEVLTTHPGQYNYRIVNMQGQVLISSARTILHGLNYFSQEASKLASGQYCFIMENSQQKITRLFFKN